MVEGVFEGMIGAELHNLIPDNADDAEKLILAVAQKYNWPVCVITERSIKNDLFGMLEVQLEDYRKVSDEEFDELLDRLFKEYIASDGYYMLRDVEYLSTSLSNTASAMLEGSLSYFIGLKDQQGFIGNFLADKEEAHNQTL